jgi:hypothetical protein
VTRLLPVLALLVLALAGEAAAQDSRSARVDSVLVTPGAQYTAGPLYRAFMGSGHRALWTMPIRVPVADLSTLAGGLTPQRVGGGMTTRTLHLDGADGHRYVFRSVDKEPGDLIEDFVGTPIEALLRDQISAFHPSGAMVVARLLDAVGVLHPSPRLVVVPDDPRLGDFREEFAGMLALFEERPDDAPEGAPGFAGSRQIVQTDRLFEETMESPLNRVASDELLRARLVDLVVGDRDRSTNNHLWARFDQADGGFVWRPIPRDRDQAFVQLDGILKGLGRYYEPRLVFWGARYPSVVGLTRNAWDIDRTYLVGVSRAEWSATVAEVQRRLSDEVIAGAVRELPPEHYALGGADLEHALRQRRDELPAAAAELYGIIFGHADIQATDAGEVADVERRGDGSLRVVIRLRDAPGDTTFDRTFSAEETREVRLYMHGGSDVVQAGGEGPGGILLRAIGGAGADRFVDASTTDAGANAFYDGGDATEVSEGPGTRFERRSPERPFSWFLEHRTLDWGSSWIPEPRVAYDADRGLVLTAGLTYDRYGFLKEPYHSRVRLRVGWSFGLSEPLVDYRHHFRDVLAGRDLRIEARWSGIELIDYYGLGNETPSAGPAQFHRVAHKQVSLAAFASLGDGVRRRLSIGPVFQYLATDTAGASSYLAATRPYGSGRFSQVGLRTAFEINGRDREGTPSDGYFLEGGGSLFPSYLDVDRGAFGELHGQAAAYLSPVGTNPTLALRAQAKKVWGPYPFADAAFLGGRTSLRGLREQRLTGDAVVLGSGELRIHLARLLFIVPADVGVFALGDAGRVFRRGESSSEWHTGWGGGIWLAPLRRSSTMQLSVARSGSRTAFYAGIGFAF